MLRNRDLESKCRQAALVCVVMAVGLFGSLSVAHADGDLLRRRNHPVRPPSAPVLGTPVQRPSGNDVVPIPSPHPKQPRNPGDYTPAASDAGRDGFAAWLRNVLHTLRSGDEES